MRSLLLLVILGAATKANVNADQASTRLPVLARVVISCKVSTPATLRVQSVAATTDAVRVSCDKPAAWKVDVDRREGKVNVQPASDVIRVPISF